jgi:hypothetical protein
MSTTRQNAEVPRDPVTGLAHVATVSFLASRATPSAQFWVALSGGVALARAASVAGLRAGYGASAAAMLQTVAVMGPARLNAPLTQAMTAPLLGRMEARGARLATQYAACLAIRLVHYAVLYAFFVWIVLGGLDAYAGTYEALTGWLGFVPQGETAALLLGSLFQVGWALGFTLMQVLVYRRALRAWPAADGVAAGSAPDDLETGPGASRFDPRAIAAACVLATGVLLATTAWVPLLGVAAWLAVVWVLGGGDREPLRLGAALAAVLAMSALTAALVGGLGPDEAVRRALRALLLVAVATWLRSAAGPEGLRETFRRTLTRLRGLPSAREAVAVLDGLDSGPRLIAAGRAWLAALTSVRRRPLPVADAAIAWVAAEAAAFRAGASGRPARLAVKGRDAVLVALAAVPAVAVAGAVIV